MELFRKVIALSCIVDLFETLHVMIARDLLGEVRLQRIEKSRVDRHIKWVAIKHQRVNLGGVDSLREGLPP